MLVPVFYISHYCMREHIRLFMLRQEHFPRWFSSFCYHEEGSVTILLKKHSTAEFCWFRTENFSFVMLLITITATLYSVSLRAASIYTRPTLTLQIWFCMYKNLVCIWVIPRQTEQFLTFMSPIFMKLFTGILQTEIHLQLFFFFFFQSIILIVNKYPNF